MDPDALSIPGGTSCLCITYMTPRVQTAHLGVEIHLHARVHDRGSRTIAPHITFALTQFFHLFIFFHTFMIRVYIVYRITRTRV